METIYRLEPVLIPGKAWAVQVATGNRKKGTKRAVLVSEPVYTLAQAQCFVCNNRAADSAHMLAK